MSEPIGVSQEMNMPYETRAVNLVKKNLYGQRHGDFCLSMKQCKQSRYFVIKKIKCANFQRIYVPMDRCPDFLIKLHAFRMLGDFQYLVTPVGQYNGGYLKMSLSMSTEAGRKYEFECWAQGECFILNICFKYRGRVDNITLDRESLAAFLDTIENFLKDYPSLNDNDDFCLDMNRRFDKRRGFHTRGSRSNRMALCPLCIQPFGGESQQDINVQPKLNESAVRRNTRALTVCTDPAPFSISCNAKKYLFEIVEGNHSFLRLTEMIRDRKKTTLHIPTEFLKSFQDALVGMNDRLLRAGSDENSDEE